VHFCIKIFLPKHNKKWKPNHIKIYDNDFFTKPLGNYIQQLRKLFKSGEGTSARQKYKARQKAMEYLCSLNWQLWRHKHWNMTSLIFVSMFKQFLQCFISPQRSLFTLHPRQAQAGWPDCTRCILPNIYETLPNSLPNYKYNILQIILPKFCQIYFIKRFTLTMDPILIVLLKLI